MEMEALPVEQVENSYLKFDLHGNGHKNCIWLLKLKKRRKKKEDKGMIDPIATQVSVSVGVSFKMESHF